MTIDAGETSGTADFSLVVTEDTIADPDETVTVSGTATDFTIINPATLTIDDNADTAPTEITLSATPTSVAEGVTQTVTVTATLSPTDITLPGATEVTVSVAAGTAQAADFGTVTSFMVTIAAGATSGEGTFEFVVTDDEVADPGETVTVSGTATGFTTINPGDADDRRQRRHGPDGDHAVCHSDQRGGRCHPDRHGDRDAFAH